MFSFPQIAFLQKTIVLFALQIVFCAVQIVISKLQIVS